MSNDALLRRRLMGWYREHGRHDLPWRLTRDPYAVLLSEVMLQQTQVARVLPYYEAWMERWPTVAALAGASAGDTIREWGGLGYNRRAVFLHRTASTVMADNGRIPKNIDQLVRLPGIGPYTARAVACFAFGTRTTVADTNIARVMSRALLGLATPKGAPSIERERAARELLPLRNARDHNLALMDLGATVCTARAPGCNVCPLVTLCAWRAAGYPVVQSEAASGAVPFEHSARFGRGRIVENLRAQRSASTSDLARGLPEAHAARVDEYLEALERDGVIEHSGDDEWRLPV